MIACTLVWNALSLTNIYGIPICMVSIIILNDNITNKTQFFFSVHLSYEDCCCMKTKNVTFVIVTKKVQQKGQTNLPSIKHISLDFRHFPSCSNCHHNCYEYDKYYAGSICSSDVLVNWSKPKESLIGHCGFWHIWHHINNHISIKIRSVSFLNSLWQICFKWEANSAQKMVLSQSGAKHVVIAS